MNNLSKNLLVYNLVVFSDGIIRVGDACHLVPFDAKASEFSSVVLWGLS